MKCVGYVEMEALQMNKKLKVFAIVIVMSELCIIISFFIRQLSISTVEISIYCKSTENLGIILYADNCSEGYPYGSGGPCIAMPLNKGNEIQKITYIIPKGTENKIRFDFDVWTNSDIVIKNIEIKYPNFNKNLMPANIIRLFTGLDESNLNAEGMVEITNIACITSLSCLDYSDVKKVFAPDWAFAWKCVKIVLVLAGVLYVVFVLYFKQEMIPFNRFSQIIIMFVSAVVVVYVSLLFEKEGIGAFEHNDIPIKIVAWNIIIVLWTIWVIRNLSNFKIGICLTTVLMALFECINYFKIILRQENFLPWDISIAKEAIRVINIANLPWCRWLVALVSMIILIFVLIFPIKLGKYAKVSLKARVFSLGILFCLGVWGGGIICKENIFSIRQYDIAGSYSTNGVLISFLYFCQNTGDKKPNGYTQDSVNSIIQRLANKEDILIKGATPNIIMVMGESFWNPEILTDVEYNEHFMKRFKEISNNACSGNVLAPVYGGGTCNAEFEALTGFSMDYIQKGLMPYMGVIHDDFFSVARYLKNKGYYTVAMHPNNGSYYRREKIYPLLGFQRSVFVDEFEEDIVRLGWLYSDDTVVRKIIDIYEQNRSIDDAPQFIFAVTIQNHQPFGEESMLKTDASTYVSSNLSEETIKQLDDFSAGINASSDAFGKLIDYFSDCEEPTIVIYWGDHMGSLGNGYELAYDAGYLRENDDTDYYMYLTPIVVWDNYIGLNERLETRSTFQILPTVFSKYKLEMPEYFRFLNDIQTYSLGRSHHKIVLDSEGRANYDGNSQLDVVYQQMELLQYDYIYGKKYAETLFDCEKQYIGFQNICGK